MGLCGKMWVVAICSMDYGGVKLKTEKKYGVVEAVT